MNIGKIITQLRKHRRKTQTQFAKELGVSLKHLNELENSKKEPRWQLLMKILKLLDAEFAIKYEVTQKIEFVAE